MFREQLFAADSLAAKAGVEALLRLAGRNHREEALAGTPDRVVRAMLEMTSGYAVDTGKLLGVTFSCEFDELVVLNGIEFTSLCEHHMLPFSGRAAVGYIPAAHRVVGLSKLARLVDAHARRLQLQERLCQDVVLDLVTHLKPLGAACRVVATHSCLGCRGARQPRAQMVTCRLHGAIRDDAAARAEFLAAAGE